MSQSLSRRSVVTAGAAALANLGLSHEAEARPTPDDFTFVHITDIHIQPELGASLGVAKAFNAIHALPRKPDFALIGGDLVMDATNVSKQRADAVYDLWQTAASNLALPMHYCIGNHDAYGLGEAAADSAHALQNPDFGKSIWKRRLGLSNTYNFFDHKGWRFVILDSILVGPDGTWGGNLDDDQLKWFDDLLRKTPKTTPVIVLTHIPILTIFGQYTAGTTAPLPTHLIVKNGKAFQEMIQGRNVKAVFQGHTHVVEECDYLGTRYITGGAICGNWWKGPRLGVHPEGFAVVTVRGGDVSWRYVPYGWDASKYIRATPNPVKKAV